MTLSNRDTEADPVSKFCLYPGATRKNIAPPSLQYRTLVPLRLPALLEAHIRRGKKGPNMVVEGVIAPPRDVNRNYETGRDSGMVRCSW